MTDYSNKLLELKERLTSILFTYKQNLISTLKEEIKFLGEDDKLLQEMEIFFMQQGCNDSHETYINKIDSILKKNQDEITKIVSGLLYELCSEIINVFFDDSLGENEQVRVQFRVFNLKTKSHEGLTNHSLKGKIPVALRNITSVPWGNGLIEKSYNKKVPLIYSLNKDNVTDRLQETNWKDYITYVPNVASNEFYHSKSRKSYPVITFGINCDFDDCYLFFETLSLLSTKTVIDDFLLNIHNSFRFSFESLLRRTD